MASSTSHQNVQKNKIPELGFLEQFKGLFEKSFLEHFYYIFKKSNETSNKVFVEEKV